MSMRKIHRILAIFAIFFGLYMSVSGILLQSIDLKTILSHAPASDANLRAIREGRDGPANFQVATDADFTAQALPAAFDYDRALATVMPAARRELAGADARFVEFRMVDGRPVGQVSSNGKVLRIDASDGRVLIGADTAAPPPAAVAGNRPALRNTVKNFHRMLAYGDIGQILFVVFAIGMCVMLATGLILYFRMLAMRRRMHRRALFWSGGGAWRGLHRGLAIAAALFLIVVVGSGTIEAIGSLGVVVYRNLHHGKRPGLTADVSAPLADRALPRLLHGTLDGYRAGHPATPIRVVRLRSFAGNPQGVVVTGGDDARQFAYDATTGAPAGLSGPNYPFTGQTFGWASDQFFKGIHRGDAFGLTGRWMSLLTGLALLFLSISGMMMYGSMWNKRRRAGRSGPFW